MAAIDVEQHIPGSATIVSRIIALTLLAVMTQLTSCSTPRLCGGCANRANQLWACSAAHDLQDSREVAELEKRMLLMQLILDDLLRPSCSSLSYLTYAET